MSDVNSTSPESISDGIPEVALTVRVSEVTQAPVDNTLSVEGMAADAKATGQAINNLNTTLSAAINALFPIGSVYVSTLATAPEFYGTWTEITIPVTHGDLEDGMRSYTDGTGTGTLHFWRRTA